MIEAILLQILPPVREVLRVCAAYHGNHPDDQEEYTSLDEAPRFSLQGLTDALADIGEGTGETLVEEYTMMLEVTMADRPGWPHPSTFSWNAGMVMHILKSDPVLQELEHVQVDGPGTAYLFFYDKQAVGIWGRMPRMLSELTWRRLFQSGSHTPPTSPLASSL